MAIGVIGESIISYIAIQQSFPQLNKIGPLQALFAEIGIAIFIAVVVYVYSVRSEKIRKARLRRQIISSFQMLCTDFAWLATQKSSTWINEEFITKKNLRIFHIQNLISELPERLGQELSATIPDFCEAALGVPMIKRPLDPTKPLTVDYTACEKMMLDATCIWHDLDDKWTTEKK